MRIKESLTDRLFLAFIYIALSLFSLMVLVPFMQIITLSLSPAEVSNKFGLHLFPTKITWEGYRMIFKDETVITSYINTIIRTVLGVTISVTLIFMAAYPLSKKILPHRKAITIFMFVTMYFSGGLIPLYLVVIKLGMRNTVWALVIPGAISTFWVLVTRNFISALPDSLEESAVIEGANDLQVLWLIILPLSKPIIATLALYSGVNHWNAWFDCLLYISEQKKYVIQLVLRRILLDGTDVQQEILYGQQLYVSPVALKMAMLTVTMIPIIMVYPFLQKHFVKGVLIGSIKG